MSIKCSGRLRRTGEQNRIEPAEISEHVAILAQMGKFWSYMKNEENLERFRRRLALEKYETLTLRSMVVDDEIIPSVHKNENKVATVNELNCWEGGADNKIINHASWLINMGETRYCALKRHRYVGFSSSSSTFSTIFAGRVLSELWLRYGTSET